MHRDMKVGLALAVLLIGVVSAFFFRNEPEPKEQIPKLEDPGRLDDQIAEKQVAPYLTGVDAGSRGRSEDRGRGNTFSSATQSTTKNQTAAPADPFDGSRKPPKLPEDWELPDFLREPEENGKSGDPAHANRVKPADPLTPPDPIRIAPSPADRNEKGNTGAGVRIPEHNNAWDVAAKKSTGQTAEGSGSRNSGGEKTSASSTLLPGSTLHHRVEKGDTLSSLAARYLGSSTRFLDIYEANRDQLKTPNDLQVGMELRIPSQPGAAQPASSSSSSPPNATDDKPAGKPRFVPVPRHPFRSGGIDDNRSSRLDADMKPVKRLWQVPPPDLPEVGSKGIGNRE